MKARILALLAAAVFSTGARAGDDILGALSRETGLNTRDVKMVLGARSGYAEYLASYDQTRKRFIRALGKPRYLELMAGRRIALLAPGQRLAYVEVKRPAR